jgi:hypothetical protein
VANTHTRRTANRISPASVVATTSAAIWAAEPAFGSIAARMTRAEDVIA